MLSLKQCLTDIAGLSAGLIEYFSLKNQVLWTGSWSSGSITVPNTSKYRTFIGKGGIAYA